MDINQVYYNRCEKLFLKTPNNFIDLLITSPPYADMTNYGEKINIMDPDFYAEWFVPIAKEIHRTLKNSGSFILNIGDKVNNLEKSIYVFDLICKIVRETDLKLFDIYYWYKKSGLPTGSNNRLFNRTEFIFHFVKNTHDFKNHPNRIRIPYAESTIKRMNYDVGIHKKINTDGLSEMNLKKIEPNSLGKLPDNVFRFPTAGTVRGGSHPAAFHLDLPKFFIKWLTNKNDLILDPFMGSGTVAIAAIMMERNYIGFEMNKEYKKVIDNRIKNYRPQKILNKFF